jgi:hypothetical protein
MTAFHAAATRQRFFGASWYEPAEAVRGHQPADVAEQLRALVQLPSGNYADDLGVVVVRPTDQNR